MAKLTEKQIRELARTIVLANPGGIRFTPLWKQIHQENPETNSDTIRWGVWNLNTLFPNEISKPSRGLFMPAAEAGAEPAISANTEQITPGGAKIKESDFYQPFADWLTDDINEANAAVSLGGAALKSKWGTPDVVGIYKPTAGNLIKFDIEVVSAEIKIDPQAPVVAFGQAVACRLFSHKTYIAMPTTLTEEDKDRLESLCMLFGVGLVLFDLSKDSPAFSIRVRAQRFFPDMFYVNKFADDLKSHNLAMFEKLF